MDDFQKLLLDEIRINRVKIEENEKSSQKRDLELNIRMNKLTSSMNFFKGKAIGFLSVFSILFNVVIGYVTKK